MNSIQFLLHTNTHKLFHVPNTQKCTQTLKPDNIATLTALSLPLSQTHTHTKSNFQTVGGRKTITQYFFFSLHSSSTFILFFPGFISAKRPSQRYCSSLLRRILSRNQIKMLFISHLRCFSIGFPKDTHTNTDKKNTAINAQNKNTLY